jgi:hypothetical protein
VLVPVRITLSGQATARREDYRRDGARAATSSCGFSIRRTTLRKSLIALVAVAALAVPASAAATVKVVSVTSPVSPGSYATLTAKVSRPATCKIVVMYKSGSSHASGLYPKRSVRGLVSWTWKVGTNTTGGRWPIFVSCGSAGAVERSFVVR